MSFSPAPPPATFQPPEAWIDPDQSLGWIRRILPALRPHRRVMFGALLASLLMLELPQAAIPTENARTANGKRPVAVLARNDDDESVSE